jgi:hypothetical protein
MEVKDIVRIAFISKQTLENGCCYLGLRPIVDINPKPLEFKIIRLAENIPQFKFTLRYM